MNVDAVSDLHGHYPELEGGDLLIVAGDLTAMDTQIQLQEFCSWLTDQDYKCKVIIAGNHDRLLQKHPLKFHGDITNCHYLCDSGMEFEYSEPVRDLFNESDKTLVYRKTFKIWGSPWTRSFEGMNPACMAFTERTENDLMKHFEKIPDDTDILVTHSPAFEVLDEVSSMWHDREVVEHCGSKYLYGWLKYSGRPKVHVCGHIHEGYGKSHHFTSCISVNAAHMNGRYEPVNAPIRVIL